MPYIKISEDNNVTLGGMVAPSNEWVMYEGPIPKGTHLLWDPIRRIVHVNVDAEFAYFKEAIEEDIAHLIYGKVDEYNQANSVAFKDIYACAFYRDMMDYTHQPFCASVWEWQTRVWEFARSELAKMKDGTREIPTTEEFIAELPAYTGV